MVWVVELVERQARTKAATSLQAGINVDDMLGSGRLDEGDSIELALENDQPTKICSGGGAEGDGADMLSGEGIEEPGD